MHIGGMGDTKALAAAVKAIYGRIDEVRAAQPRPQKIFAGANIGTPNSISPEPLEVVLGMKGHAKDGMFKVVVGRTARHWSRKRDGHQHLGGFCRN